MLVAENLRFQMVHPALRLEKLIAVDSLMDAHGVVMMSRINVSRTPALKVKLYL